MQIREVPGGPGTLMVWDDQRGLVMIFASGFAAIYFVIGAMYWHAYRMREELHLSAFETAHTMTSVVSQALTWCRSPLAARRVPAEARPRRPRGLRVVPRASNVAVAMAQTLARFPLDACQVK